MKGRKTLGCPPLCEPIRKRAKKIKAGAVVEPDPRQLSLFNVVEVDGEKRKGNR